MTDSAVLTLVDGEPANVISVADRGLAYGDGVFETIRLMGGLPVLLEAHLDRLMRGCERLGIEGGSLRSLVTSDIDRLDSAGCEAVVKVIVTRGAGGRGYAPPAAQHLTRIVSLHSWESNPRHWQAGIIARTCRTRLAINPLLAGIKHLARLEQVMAAAELRANETEGLMLDTGDHVIEGTRSNLFLVEGDHLVTPALAGCGVAGVMRQYLMANADVRVEEVTLDRVERATELFVCNSVFGIYSIASLHLDDRTIEFTRRDRTMQLQQHINEAFGAW